MKKNEISKGLTILFIAFSILDIIGIALHKIWLQAIFKPMIILSVIILYYFSAEQRSKWYISALFFSFFGDVFLLDKNGYFLLGIGSFLITQILYIKIISGQLKKPNSKQIFGAIALFMVYFIVLISLLKNNLNEFLIPVIVYGITISIFGIVSLLNYFINRTKISQILLWGSVLFIISDSMIALHKFHEPRPFYPVAIMITYILAQYLIYRFMLGLKEKS